MSMRLAAGRWFVPFFVGTLLALRVVCAPPGARGQGAGSPSAAARLADEWAPPSASRTEGESYGSARLLVRNISHGLPLSAVWTHYAGRCGLGKQYSTQQLYITHGARGDGEYVWHDVAAAKGGRVRTHVAYTDSKGTVAITFSPEGAHTTAIIITAATR